MAEKREEKKEQLKWKKEKWLLIPVCHCHMHPKIIVSKTVSEIDIFADFCDFQLILLHWSEKEWMLFQVEKLFPEIYGALDDRLYAMSANANEKKKERLSKLGRDNSSFIIKILKRMLNFSKIVRFLCFNHKPFTVKLWELKI